MVSQKELQIRSILPAKSSVFGQLQLRLCVSQRCERSGEYCHNAFSRPRLILSRFLVAVLKAAVRAYRIILRFGL